MVNARKARNRERAAALAAGGGAALLPAPPGTNQPQPFGVYYDRFGVTYHLPSDTWSVEHYRTRKNNPLSLRRPSRPAKKAVVAAVGTDDDWDWSMVKKPGHEATVAVAGPTATYYTKDGLAIENLPADPESMLRYLNEVGLSLTPPKETP